MTEKPTVALCMIVKDEFEPIVQIIYNAYPYFDELIFTVSDKRVAEKLATLMQKQPKVTVVYRKWNNRFDEARNANVGLCASKYYFWMDADDQFEFKAIPKLLEIAEAGQYDQIMLPYDYARNDDGETVAYHWRERLMRTSHPFTWKGWVHETPITNLPYKAHRVNVPVIHQNKDEHNEESLRRNHQILLEATAQTDDPRYQLYLGTSHYSLGEHGEALQVLDKFVKVSGNTEDIYRALCCMAECAAHLKEPNVAIKFASQAMVTIPEFPQAYRLLAQFEMDGKNWVEALEWCKTADSKPLNQGLGVFDPTVKNQTYLIAAHCLFMLGEHNKALRWLRKLPEDHPARGDFEVDFIKEADAETFVAMLPKIRKYFENEEVLYNALCHDMKYDSRLRGLRDIVVPPKKWPDNSIAILCGEGFEEWGPHTLDKGMGGSEEAVVYLSREMSKLGWDVTVYGPVKKPIEDELPNYNVSVHYLPWKEINKSDNFNIFVAWRAPDFAEHIKAKVKVADIHDLLAKDTVKPYEDVTYFFKSKWHREQYSALPDDKARVIGNGILKEQFK